MDSGRATLNGLRERGGSAWGIVSQSALILSQSIARLLTVRSSTATAALLSHLSLTSSLIQSRNTQRLQTSHLYFRGQVKLSKATCGFTKFCSVWPFWFTQVSFFLQSEKASYWVSCIIFYSNNCIMFYSNSNNCNTLFYGGNWGYHG